MFPLEIAILEAGGERAKDGDPEFHGFAVAQAIQEHDAARRLTYPGERTVIRRAEQLWVGE